MEKRFTALIRKSGPDYVAVCLELNVGAQGEDLSGVENNLRSAITLFLQEIRDNPETVVEPISTKEIIEFLQDTTSEPPKKEELFTLRPLEVLEISCA